MHVFQRVDVMSYTIKMSKDLSDVPLGKLSNICTFLNGTYGGSDGATFTLDGASKPSLRSVNTAFARENLLSYSCLSVT